MSPFLKTRSKLLKLYGRSYSAITGTAILCIFIFMAIFASSLAPHDPYQQNLRARLLPILGMEGNQKSFILGTDMFGRDVFSNIIFGIRISLLVGVLCVLISCILGLIAGLISGYKGGRVDALIMRIADIQFSLPLLLIAMAAMAILGRGLFKLILVVGIVGWAEYGRTVRSSTLSIKEKEFVEAIRALGAHDFRIMLRHILPNTLSPVLVLVVVNIPRVIILEATLSFLGLGIPITTPSLGIMISLGYNYLLSGSWWLSIFPGIALMLLVLSINLLGDWVRDVFDPKLRG